MLPLLAAAFDAWVSCVMRLGFAFFAFLLVVVSRVVEGGFLEIAVVVGIRCFGQRYSSLALGCPGPCLLACLLSCLLFCLAVVSGVDEAQVACFWLSQCLTSQPAVSVRCCELCRSYLSIMLACLSLAPLGSSHLLTSAVGCYVRMGRK